MKKIVEVEWLDAASVRGWSTVVQAVGEDSGISRVTSIGYLVAQDKLSVSISTSWDDAGKFMDVLSIPRAAITKMKVRKA